jgi:hypothetical protein
MIEVNQRSSMNGGGHDGYVLADEIVRDGVVYIQRQTGPSIVC